MKTAHKYAAGSVLVAALGIGLVVYLYNRKPTVNVSGVITVGDPVITYPGVKAPPETEIERLIRVSSEAIAADDAE